MTSASSIGARVTLSRFRAPRVTSRNRSGRADADWKPALRAAAENDGQRPDPASRFSCPTRSPVRKASRQGPSCSWSSNSSSRRIASLEEATSPRVPAGEASITPAAERPSRLTHRSATPVSKSTTSWSSTRLSAISTSDRTTSASRVISFGLCKVWRLDLVVRSRILAVSGGPGLILLSVQAGHLRTHRRVLLLAAGRQGGLAYPAGWSRWVSAVWRRPAPGVRTAWASARRDPARTMSFRARVTPV